MATILEQVVNRIEALALTVLAGQAGVYVDVADPMSLEQAPWLNVLPEGGPVESWDLMDMHKSTISLHFSVRGDRGSAAADALHKPLHAAMASDPTLYGLVESLRLEDEVYEREPADQTTTTKKCRYRVTYLVQRNTL